MGTRYFFDTYALFEIVRGAPDYAEFKDESIVTSIFNITELYWSVLREFGKIKADRAYSLFRQAVTEIDDDTLKAAMRFKLKHKKQRLSYADCIGYIYAVRHQLQFLTGDKEFKNVPDVRFVK